MQIFVFATKTVIIPTLKINVFKNLTTSNLVSAHTSKITFGLIGLTACNDFVARDDQRYSETGKRTYCPAMVVLLFKSNSKVNWLVGCFGLNGPLR